MDNKSLLDTLLDIGKGTIKVVTNVLKTVMEINEIEKKFVELKTIFDVRILSMKTDEYFPISKNGVRALWLKRFPYNVYSFAFDLKENKNNRTFMSLYPNFTGEYVDRGGSSKYNYVFDLKINSSLIFYYSLFYGLIPGIYQNEEQVKWLNFFSEAFKNNVITYDGKVNHSAKNCISQINTMLVKFHLVDAYTIPTDEIHKYLNCDKVRIGTAPYEEQMLLDANKGHWDIAEPIKIGDKTYHPRQDIHKDIKSGTVGIDFGTKSTIVCFQNDSNKTLPLPIGVSEGDELNDKRNENPTIMEFCSLKNFMEAYQKSDSRPETKWADLKISRKAKEDFEDVSDDEFNAFLDNLKQWAGGRNNRLNVVPTKEKTEKYELKSFLDIAEEDFNPIEYYAYLIGLFVNNMRLGIHLNYYLSIPVKYDANVKAKLRDSFERGIRKSLPKAILNDANTMKRFFVKINRKDDNNNDVFLTEPLAYAVCALQEYKIDTENGSVNYAIFDFGGGTVDYDFGVWSDPDDFDDYDYKIKTFGGDGMPIMGGENILEDLACKVFEANLPELRKEENNKIRKFQFQLGPTCSEFEMWDEYIADTIPASRNMFKMREALRMYWENAQENLIDKADKKVEIDLSSVQLTDSNGEKSTLKIKTSVEFIEGFFKEKINEAINNFFVAMDSVKDNFDGTEIKIFLAGNSSKSPFVKSLFDEKIKQMEQEDQTYTYQVYYPLGSNEAIDYLQSNNISFNPSITGKTGVAFGLIDCRESGRIQIDSDTREKFEYYLGKLQKGKFKSIDGFENGRPVIGQWFAYKNVKNGNQNFEIYYTNLPESLSGEMDIIKSKSQLGYFDEYSGSGAKIYIRATGPHTLEFAISEVEPDGNYRGEIHKLEL